MSQVTPSIWFQGNAEEAMNFYVQAFPNSKIVHIERYAGDQGIPDEAKLKGKVLTGMFEVAGQSFSCLDGGPYFQPGGNVSFMVEFESQDELDKTWEQLLDGGKTQQCGWITDKYGTTWQIVPASLGRLMSDANATQAQKKAVMEAMMPMVKMDGPKLEAAFNNAKE
jgi:predicted 3-demethylubiquinone-9 3-methyltransferase (glyoxalase superfamily)